MGGFTKLFSDIILSSIWSEDDKTRIVWVTLLAISNADGFVSGSLPGLAAAARVSVSECDTALQKLASPDPHSRTKDHEGRRIEVVDGGWLILNYRAYRDRVSDDPNAVAARERVRRFRERKRQSLPPDPQPGTTTTEDRGQKQKQGNVTSRYSNTEAFEIFWKAYPRKEDKIKAREAFEKHIASDADVLLPKILAALEWQRYSPQWTEGANFITHPAKYIKNRRWEDERSDNDTPPIDTTTATENDIPF